MFQISDKANLQDSLLPKIKKRLALDILVAFIYYGSTRINIRYIVISPNITIL